MEQRSDEEWSTTDEGDQFASALSQLKQQGSALLVVGRVPTDAYVQACSAMIGDDDAGTRRRLFITTDTDLPTVSERVTTTRSQFSTDTAKRIVWSSESRSTATPSTISQPPIATTRVDDGSLATLGITISEEIQNFEETAAGLDPAELRVCFDSLESLLSEYTQESVFRFLHVLVGRLRSVHGMGHFHLPIERDAEDVDALAELFDATIEIRIADATLQQRWHLHDADITSTWLPLSPQ